MMSTVFACLHCVCDNAQISILLLCYMARKPDPVSMFGPRLQRIPDSDLRINSILGHRHVMTLSLK